MYEYCNLGSEFGWPACMVVEVFYPTIVILIVSTPTYMQISIVFKRPALGTIIYILILIHLTLGPVCSMNYC